MLLQYPPPHTQGGLPRSQTEHMPEAFKGWSSQWLGEDIGDIITGVDANDMRKFLFDDVTDGVVFYAIVLRIRMVGQIRGKEVCSIVVTV